MLVGQVLYGIAARLIHVGVRASLHCTLPSTLNLAESRECGSRDVGIIFAITSILIFGGACHIVPVQFVREVAIPSCKVAIFFDDSMAAA